MTVAELIAELQKLDPSLPCVCSTGDEYSNMLTSVVDMEGGDQDGETVRVVVLEGTGDLVELI